MPIEFMKQARAESLLETQAIEDGLTIATPDPLIRQYAVRTIWD